MPTRCCASFSPATHATLRNCAKQANKFADYVRNIFALLGMRRVVFRAAGRFLNMIDWFLAPEVVRRFFLLLLGVNARVTLILLMI